MTFGDIWGKMAVFCQPHCKIYAKLEEIGKKQGNTIDLSVLQTRKVCNTINLS